MAFILLTMVSLHILVNTKGKSLLESKLKDTFQREATVGSVRATLPLNMVVRDIEVKDLFKIGKAYAKGGAVDIFRKSFSLSELTLKRVEVNFKKSPLPQILPEGLPSSSNTTLAASGRDTTISTRLAKEFFIPNIVLRHLMISDSILNFIDETPADRSLEIRIEDINIEVENLVFPISRSLITSFTLKGRIPWQEGRKEGKIEVQGWLNFFKKDMQATLKIEDIDGVYLYPYYSQWVDLEKARIESAKLNFTSNISGLNNNVTALCRLELIDIVRRQRPEGELGEKAEKITDAVLNIFRALSQGKIVLDFTVRTKMDKPQFGFGDIKMAFEDKLAEGKKANGLKPEEALLLPAKLIKALFKGTTDLTTAVISGTISAGKEIGKTVEGVLKKEEKKEEKKE
jgi:hypothetical protein